MKIWLTIITILLVLLVLAVNDLGLLIERNSLFDVQEFNRIGNFKQGIARCAEVSPDVAAPCLHQLLYDDFEQAVKDDHEHAHYSNCQLVYGFPRDCPSAVEGRKEKP
ncbi:MAG: hypothetical protein ABSH44_17855 [Bryobacteraceae bacterium]|jgi:hypothetical protein